MKFTALEEYGLRCILHLARRVLASPAGISGPAPVLVGQSATLGEIAEEEGLTQQYVGKIFRILLRSKLVVSERGRKGGYRLARPPEAISVAETLAALGGRIFEDELCGRYVGDRRECVHTTDCSIRSLWTGLQTMVDRVLSATSLRDLLVPESAAAEQLRSRSASPGLVTVERFTKRKE